MNENSPQPNTIGIVVTHGRLAEELLHTAELIVGRLEECFAVSGSDLCDESLVDKIKEIIGDIDTRKAIVFVDYFGGSCCTNSVRAVEGISGIKVISGVNLPLLLDFATKRGSMEFEEMVKHLIRRGRDSVRIIDF